MSGNLYKNIKSEENNSNLPPEDIIEALALVNIFTPLLEDSKNIIYHLMLSHAEGKLHLDEEVQEILVEWSKNYALYSEKIKMFNGRSKPN